MAPKKPIEIAIKNWMIVATIVFGKYLKSFQGDWIEVKESVKK